MDDVDNYLQDDKTISDSANKIAGDIVNKRIDIAELVEKLGPTLTSPDVEKRAKGMNLLSSVLNDLPTDTLNATQLNFISTFYCDRLKDHHSVVPFTLPGIQALARMNNLPDDCVARLLQSMFHNVPCQSQVKADRENIFDIIKTMSLNKTDELNRMGTDFVYGFINAMDGERDPKLLIYLLDFVPTFLSKFQLGHLTDDMFEVIACYFPVDFNPSPNDAATITRELLADKLADCLCANEGFAEECINLLVDKLDSQLSIAKLDSLHLLSKASVKFDSKAIDQHFPIVWKALRNELLPGSSRDITMAALDTLQMVINGVSKNETACTNILESITTSIIPSLSDVDSRLFMPSAAIVLKCMSPSKIASKIVALKCLPAFLLQINKDDIERLIQRTTLIELTAQVISICIENEVIDQIGQKVLEAAQFEFINCLVPNTAANEKLINVALNALAITVDIVDDSNRILVYRALNAYLDPQNENKNTSIDLRKTLAAFGTKYPDEVSTEIISPLLSTDFVKAKLSSDSLLQLFEVLSCLIPIRKFRKDILEYLIKNIFQIDEDSFYAQKIRLIALRVLHHILDEDKNEELRTEIHTEYNIFDKFISLIHSNHVNPVNEPQLTSIDDILFEMSEIIRIIISAIEPYQQRILVETYLPQLNLQLKTDLYFAMGILGYLDPSIDIENHFEKIVNELAQLSLHSDDPDMTKIANQLLCSLFNKCPDNEHHNGILKKIIQIIKDELKKHNKKAVEILSWISKGLLAKGHKEASELIDILIELLEHPTLSEAAVAAFDVISLEFPQLHLPVVKHFFKQKLFQLCMKSLWHKLEKFSENHLSAFVFVLKMTPHQVLLNEIDKIGPVLLKCLTLSKPKSILTGLDICLRFVTDQIEYFRDHLQNLIPQCLKLSTYQDSMDIRVNAIKIISAASKYPAFIILPFAQDVLLGLVPALDDKKRLVRNTAVIARNQWFLIGDENKN